MAKQIKMRRFTVSLNFVNRPSIVEIVKVNDDHFAAASKAMEITCDRWPVQRPISIDVVWEVNGDHRAVHYRLTREFTLVLDSNAYQEECRGHSR